jgi:archaellum biogenesis protein FlaJ (TadC family)
MQAANRSSGTLESVKIAEHDKKHTSEDSAAISKLLVLSFIVTVLVCIFAVHIVFGDIIPWYSTLLAIGLALPMAVVGIRALAETDYNPESALRMC